MNLIEYDETFKVSIQHPMKTNITLKPHQMVLLQKCIEFETVESTKYGMIGDKVGSGKSYVILSIINIKRGKNALIIPEHLLPQWENYIKSYGNISYNVINNFASINNLDTMQRNVDLVVIIHLTAKSIDRLNIDYRTFDRAFYDEIPQFSYLQNDDKNKDYFKLIKCNFAWIISASYSLYLDKNITCLKNKDSYVDQNMIIPDAIYTKVDCISYPLEILRDQIDPLIIKKLEAIALEDVLISFGDSKTDTKNVLRRLLLEKESQFERLTNEINNLLIRFLGKDNKEKIGKLDHTLCNLINHDLCEFEEDCKLHLQLNNSKEFLSLIKQCVNVKTSDEINILEMKRLDIKKSLINIDLLVKKYNVCQVCYDCIANMETQCCLMIYCEQCAIYFSKRSPDCPFCYESNCSAIKVNDNVPTKYDKLNTIYRLLSKYNERIIIISDYVNTFKHIQNILKQLNLSYRIFDSDLKDLNEFKVGNFNVLLINSAEYSQGLNLEFATDLISIHHSKNLHQIIGRAHRVGRTKPLRVWYLRYDNELL